MFAIEIQHANCPAMPIATGVQARAKGQADDEKRE
jgi:hypothetical protein